MNSQHPQNLAAKQVGILRRRPENQAPAGKIAHIRRMVKIEVLDTPISGKII
ncbi:MAG: hypothetical protein PHW79_06695 [Candidatus Marinimicrobia bacterium]|nr:hypothetical protein [Candidatus Neomarinimicrobiota bacterium]